MILMYNETSTPWEAKQVNEFVYKLISTKEIDTDKQIYMDILLSNDVKLDDTDLSKYVEMEDIATLTEMSTNVTFQKKNCKPFIGTGLKFNKDVLFINVNLLGSIVSHIDTKNAFVLNSYLVKGQLALIVSLDKEFSFTLYNAQEKTSTKYRFFKDNGKYDIELTYENDVKEQKKVTITKYRPNKPTHLIFAKSEDMDALHKQLSNKHKKEPSHLIYDIEKLKENIDITKAQNYNAATLFINRDNYKPYDGESEKSTTDVVLDTIKDNYRVVNILLKNGKIIKK